MKILIGCERSGIVREAFRSRGHDAWSCDLFPTAIPGQHLQCNVMEAIHKHWDMAIFHPDCRYLCFSGERWQKNNPERQQLRTEAFNFFKLLYEAPIARIAIENSHSVFLNREFRKPDQAVQPWQFGCPFQKMTCLWLRGLPPLVPTNILPIGHRHPACHLTPPGPDRSAKRAQTYPGIATAMAHQWG